MGTSVVKPRWDGYEPPRPGPGTCSFLPILWPEQPPLCPSLTQHQPLVPIFTMTQCPRRSGKWGNGQVGREAKAWSGSGLLRGDRQPTSLLSDLSSEKANPGTLRRNVETSLCSIGKNATPLPPMGRWDPGMGFRTQAKVLMGLLEAANCGVSQGAELAGSRPN